MTKLPNTLPIPAPAKNKDIVFRQAYSILRRLFNPEDENNSATFTTTDMTILKFELIC